MSSAPRRDKCVPTSAIANSTSATKSRSPVASSAFGETLAVADERPRVRQQHVRPAHRLGALAVGVAGENRVEPIFRFGDERAAEGGDGGVELVDSIDGPESQVRGDLVVARAAGMELPRHRTDFRVEQPLDERVHVFIGSAGGGAVSELVGDAVESFEQLRFFRGGQDARAAQRVYPRLAGGDVLRPETMIDGEAAV